mmetsp:Transcript_15292/g.26318  ORF Transcript_15292/g.26318 Transcript_15292/m.26318 type:complete len:203 (-) Transcript_15292:466-1074(-)
MESTLVQADEHAPAFLQGAHRHERGGAHSAHRRDVRDRRPRGRQRSTSVSAPGHALAQLRDVRRLAGRAGRMVPARADAVHQLDEFSTARRTLGARARLVARSHTGQCRALAVGRQQQQCERRGRVAHVGARVARSDQRQAHGHSAPPPLGQTVAAAWSADKGVVGANARQTVGAAATTSRSSCVGEHVVAHGRAVQSARQS